VSPSGADPVAPKARYEELLKRLHWALLPRTYLEIGVHSGASIQFTTAATSVLAVDPEPQVTYELPSRVQLFAATSDDFFADHDPSALLDGRTIDLAFIDGMHLFEFALRDFINTERSMNPDGVVLIDDCYPSHPEEAARDRSTPRWTGDVWKVVVCLRALRPDLDVRVIDVAPAGVAIVTGLDPSSTILADAYDELVATYVDMDYDAIDGREHEQLNIQPFEWAAIEQTLDHLPLGPSSAKLQAQRWLALVRLDAKRWLPRPVATALGRLRAR